ncbi:hypothetical protein N7D90_18195 [Pseudomonas fragi]|uniref:hypothetical protein n=1 Tax=Pseudomonas fragi TaxID=296 RepID=UPI0021C125CC|nr:hypothetical protein [Pseudomonas fragi]UXL37489.1 hypothetical protein N7D90_18195 [Pseudomonas fragi]
MQIALQQKAIIANCNQPLSKTYFNQLFYIDFYPFYSWHEDCSSNSTPSMLSEMTAMNSTLLLLNALALAVLAAVHFQTEPASAEQPVEIAAVYSKPLKPLPQLAVMNAATSVAPHLATNDRPTREAAEVERWFF